MPRLQVYLSDELFREMKRHKLSPSELLRGAVAEELERRRKRAQLDAYLKELRREVGEGTKVERATAEALATRVDHHLRRSGTRRAG